MSMSVAPISPIGVAPIGDDSTRLCCLFALLDQRLHGEPSVRIASGADGDSGSDLILALDSLALRGGDVAGEVEDGGAGGARRGGGGGAGGGAAAGGGGRGGRE